MPVWEADSDLAQPFASGDSHTTPPISQRMARMKSATDRMKRGWTWMKDRSADTPQAGQFPS